MSRDQHDRKDQSQGEDQEAGQQGQSDGSDVIGGGSGRSSGSSDVQGSSDLGPNTGADVGQPAGGGEVY